MNGEELRCVQAFLGMSLRGAQRRSNPYPWLSLWESWHGEAVTERASSAEHFPSAGRVKVNCPKGKRGWPGPLPALQRSVGKAASRYNPQPPSSAAPWRGGTRGAKHPNYNRRRSRHLTYSLFTITYYLLHRISIPSRYPSNPCPAMVATQA